MVKNLKKYYQAWELRQQGKKLREIAKIMGFKSGEWARTMVSHVNFKVNSNMKKSNELLKLMQKYIKNNKGLLLTFLLFYYFLFIFSSTVLARSGCCSYHGGVCGCGCCDGSSLSSTCAPYYPQCSGSGGGYQQPVVYNPLEYMNATKSLYPNYDGETFDIDIELADSSPSSYSVTLNKCYGCNPGPSTDFYTKKFSFVDVRPGRWYMNVKKEVGGYWSTTTVWTIDIPEWYSPPVPTLVPTSNETSPQSQEDTIPLTTYAGIGVGGYFVYKLVKKIKNG